jgi:regulator of nonsense transcripts 1
MSRGARRRDRGRAGRYATHLRRNLSASPLLYKNEPEITVVVHLARLYYRQGKEYRVITPYDAQRSAIEKQLELANLPWQDKCFNVDSFQGKRCLDMLKDLSDIRCRK